MMHARRVNHDIGTVMLPCPFCHTPLQVTTTTADVTYCEHPDCQAVLSATVSVVAIRMDRHSAGDPGEKETIDAV